MFCVGITTVGKEDARLRNYLNTINQGCINTDVYLSVTKKPVASAAPTTTSESGWRERERERREKSEVERVRK